LFVFALFTAFATATASHVLNAPAATLADGTDPQPPLPPHPHALVADGTDPQPPLPPHAHAAAA
jgi:hypothetical protein